MDRTTRNKTKEERVKELPRFCMNGYELLVKGGHHCLKDDAYYVQLKHGTEYEILVKNTNFHICRFQLKIDGRDQGTWKINSGKTVKIDCPAKDEKHRFIFLRTRHAPESSGIREGNKKNGLVNCTFMAEVDAEEIEIMVNAPTHAAFAKTDKFRLFPSASIQEMFRQAKQCYVGAKIGNPVVLLWNDEDSPAEVIDKNKSGDLRSIANNKEVLFISIVPEIPPKVILRCENGRKATLSSSHATKAAMYNVLKGEASNLNIGNADLDDCYVFSESSLRRICHVGSLENDNSLLWSMLLEKEMSCLFNQWDDTCSLTFIISQTSDLPEVEADGYIEEDGGDVVDGCVIKAGAIALIEHPTKYRYRAVEKIKTDPKKNVYLDFRIVSNDEEDCLIYDKDSIKPLHDHRRSKYPPSVPD